MTKKNHLVLVLIALCAWATFYLMGIPSNYYQEWSTAEQVLLSLVTFFGALPLIAFITMTLIGYDYIKIGLWLAFYGSLPLAIIDYIIGGVVNGNGFSVFISHWYVTIGYFYVWIILPLFGYVLEKFRQQCRDDNTR